MLEESIRNATDITNLPGHDILKEEELRFFENDFSLDFNFLA